MSWIFLCRKKTCIEAATALGSLLQECNSKNDESRENYARKLNTYQEEVGHSEEEILGFKEANEEELAEKLKEKRTEHEAKIRTLMAEQRETAQALSERNDQAVRDLEARLMEELQITDFSMLGTEFTTDSDGHYYQDTVVEFHEHSDALAPDHGNRIPFSSGTSVSYNYIDFRFRNDTDQNVQLLVWCKDGKLYGELRSERAFPQCYEIVEENHHFHKEGDKFFRISKIYRNVIDKTSGEVIDKQLIRDNHSEVMYDYSLIPKELIW